MHAAKAVAGIRPFSFSRFLLSLSVLGLLALAGTVPALATTYVHRTPLTFGWAAASGEVAYYNVYLSVDGRSFRLHRKVTGTTCRVDVEDGRSYVLRVEAEDALGRVGPMSDPSERVVVFLNGSPEDTDGDGIPDWWEILHGLNPYDPSDANQDTDGDGLTNLEKYLRDNDPNKPDDDGVGNERPVANAGPDQVVNPTVVTLDGAGSHDPDGDVLSYVWTQKSGPEVVLSNSRAVKPTFVATKAGNYVFELVVSDGRLTSLSDEVVVTVRNVAPSADAGPDLEADVGARVVLDGSGSADPNGDTLGYLWIQRSGPLVLLQGALTRTASFVPAQAGVYLFRLVTFDGRLFSPPDEVQVIVHGPANRVPTADAGEDQRARVGDTVTLDGSGSWDPDGDPLSYAWSQVRGPVSVALEGAATARAGFVAPRTGTYEFRLIVSDGRLSSPPDTVRVVVAGVENEAPVAVIVVSNPAAVGDWVVLDGSQSYDPDGIGYLSYTWTQTKGPDVVLENGDKSVAGFYAVTEGTLTFQLVVRDSDSDSLPASATVQVVEALPDRTEPPAKRPADSGGGGGCSVGLTAADGHSKSGVTEIGYLLILFLPAIGAAWYYKRRLRARVRT